MLIMFFSIIATAQSGDIASSSHTKPIYNSARTGNIGPVIKVKGRSEKKVLLNWSPFNGAVSHYVLERSLDGRNYHEAGVLFTGDWEDEPEYFYTDKLSRSYAGPLYYRLRVVGLDGTEIYTAPSITQ